MDILCIAATISSFFSESFKIVKLLRTIIYGNESSYGRLQIAKIRKLMVCQTAKKFATINVVLES